MGSKTQQRDVIAALRDRFEREWDVANPYQFDANNYHKLKKFWKDPKRENWSFFCPLCKAAHKIPFQPRPTGRHFAQMGVTAAFFTLVTWPWFEWKGVVAFFPFWIIFEALYRSRVRASVRCSHCGFDPFLYLNDVKKARFDIEQHWRKLFEQKGIAYPEKPVDLGVGQRKEPESSGTLLASSVKRPRI